MWSGTNSFGDEFHVLYLPTSPRACLDFEKQLDEAPDLWKYRAIRGHAWQASLLYPVYCGRRGDGWRRRIRGAPELKITSDVVERARADAETLIPSSGAVSGLDRVHTALHGNLKATSLEAGLSIGNDPGITELFKLLRRSHPSLSGSVAGAKEIDRILNSMASIVDAMNPLRNRGSVAHPNDELLDEAEAMLVINAVRTLLHYLNSRLHV
jgi:hypothetical protein